MACSTDREVLQLVDMVAFSLEVWLQNTAADTFWLGPHPK
ncbi:hypothetical protein RIEGSTA812A_PEG_182 [invertebrate metagenome]|uniref:Uncharacterized protein n=1 Tax=invertebrate metagenome TaxID=1711999 RepID=A0A484H4N2_9ZZZZ